MTIVAANLEGNLVSMLFGELSQIWFNFGEYEDSKFSPISMKSTSNA